VGTVAACAIGVIALYRIGNRTMSPARYPERDEAFRRIGRNIANFQILETLLKTIIPLLRFGGETEALESILKGKRKALRNVTLGALTTQLHSLLYSQQEEWIPPEDLKNSAMSFSTTVTAEDDRVRAQKRKWKALVEERNRLVHHDLKACALTDPVECERLSTHLDAQNLRILECGAEIRRMLETIVLAREKMLEALESDDWDDQFEEHVPAPINAPATE
jgi:hypothetical protein